MAGSILSLYGERNKNISAAVCMEEEEQAFLHTCPKKINKERKKILTPILPSEHRGWNAGKGDCGHYCNHLDFSVFIGTLSRWEGDQGRNLQWRMQDFMKGGGSIIVLCMKRARNS